jgi:hypothetical protein
MVRFAFFVIASPAKPGVAIQLDCFVASAPRNDKLEHYPNCGAPAKKKPERRFISDMTRRICLAGVAKPRTKEDRRAKIAG